MLTGKVNLIHNGKLARAKEPRNRKMTRVVTKKTRATQVKTRTQTKAAKINFRKKMRATMKMSSILVCLRTRWIRTPF